MVAPREKISWMGKLLDRKVRRRRWMWEL